jgi:hypothetical protein
MEKKARSPYKWGAKAYLASFEIGEHRIFNDEFRWRSLMSIASKLRREYGCLFCFSAAQGTKVIIRTR